MLVLIRHAQSTANAENRKAGQMNVPLSEEGIAQAKDLRSEIGAYRYDAVFTSDAERCQDTTRFAIGHTHPFDTWTVAEELRERSGGVLEGMNYKEIRGMFPPRKYKLWQRDYFEPPPMGESFKDVEDRLLPFAKEYIFPLANEGKNVWVCTHLIPMKILIGYIKGMDETEIPSLYIDNAVPYVLRGTVRM